MKFSRHCALCENEFSNLEKGVLCALTKRKPDFNKTCRDITLDKKFQKKLEEVTLELESTQKSRNSVLLNFIFRIILGFVLLIGNKAIADWWYNETYYWVRRVTIIGFGITTIMVAYDRLMRFRRKLKIAKFEKTKIDAVLLQYNISYETNFDYHEKKYGTQKIDVVIDYKNWTVKRTSTAYTSN